MIHVAAAGAWSVLMLAALWGWGSLLNAVMTPLERRDGPQRAALGIAFSALAGGVLNGLSILSAPCVLAYISAGILAGLLQWKRERRTAGANAIPAFWPVLREDPVALIAAAAAVLITAVHAVAWLHVPDFNHGDDYCSYLVFPVKMLQTGSMGIDPFNERHMVSSLGGAYFLQTLPLAVLGLNGINTIDISIGFVVFAALLLREAAAAPQRFSRRVALLAACLVLVESLAQVKPNVTSVMIPAALFVALFRELARPDCIPSSFRQIIYLALYCAALCSLKSTFIPPVVILMGCYFFWVLINTPEKLHLLARIAAFGGLVLLLLLPWMLAMKQSCGTLLFPLLGKGYHGSAYGDYQQLTSDLNATRAFTLAREYLFDIRTAMLLALGALAWRRGSAAAAVFCAAVIALMAAFAIFRGGLTGARYTFPLAFALRGLFAVFAATALSAKTASAKPIAPGVLILLILAFLIRLNIPILGYTVRQYLAHFAPAVQDGSFANGFSSGEQQAQRTAPEGELILAYVERPFRFDFRRNPLYLMDLPGGASLPPGLPYRKSGSDLLQYLRACGIHYLLISRPYLEQGLSGDDHFQNPNPWEQSSHRHALDFRRTVRELIPLVKKVVDDSDFVMLRVGAVRQ